MHNKMLLSHAMKVLAQMTSYVALLLSVHVSFGYNTVHLVQQPPADTDRETESGAEIA